MSNKIIYTNLLAVFALYANAQATPVSSKAPFAIQPDIRAFKSQKVVLTGAHLKRQAQNDLTYDRIVAIVIDILGVEPELVKRESSFVDDLGADSLDLVTLLQAAEMEFEIEIPDDAAEQMTTVGAAYDYISEHLI